jgi:spermidine synthase
MAILWTFDETIGNRHTHYSVRTAGASRRLYTNGAFHSQYHPQRLLSGGVWDLLTLPALYTQHGVKTLLMLGVGGGTAIHQYRRICAPRHMTGIEFNPVHLQIAEEFFDCRGPDIKLIQADAYDWIKHSRARFDVLVDDLFVDTSTDPVRPNDIDTRWMQQLERRLRPSGMIIQNHLAPKSAWQVAQDPWVQAHFAAAILFTTPHYENGVLALYKTPVNNRHGRHLATERIRALDKAAARRLNFRGQKLY